MTTDRHDRPAALLVEREPGAYTVQVENADDSGGGVALGEVYETP